MSIIRPLTIGRLTFTNNLIQGPLAGISCAPFRSLFYRFTPPAYCVTEMISAKQLVKNHQAQHRYLYREPCEQRLCYQLSGNCATTLAQACRIVTDLGADLIDLNCGCPKRKIRQKKCGSFHLEHPQQLALLVKAMRQATTVPLTIKIRVGGDVGDSDAVTVARMAEEAGADAIIVHGRHWQDDYHTACRYQQIQAVAAAVAIPVIYNGDIMDFQTLQKALQQTDCAGAMLSRAGSGQPWLYEKIIAQSKKQHYRMPRKEVRQQLLHDHVQALSTLIGPTRAALQSRQFSKYYQ